VDQRGQGLGAGRLRGAGLSGADRARVVALVAALERGELDADLLVQRDGSRCWSWREDGLRRELTLGLEGDAELLEAAPDGGTTTTISYADGAVRLLRRDAHGAVVAPGAGS
jgi:hypothetical protein